MSAQDWTDDELIDAMRSTVADVERYKDMLANGVTRIKRGPRRGQWNDVSKQLADAEAVMVTIEAELKRRYGGIA